jgi:hypothetical protein
MKKIFVIIFGILLLTGNVFAATYNSAQAGDWDADTTWTEAGHPNADDDVVTIAHVVAYNLGASAITWGNITLNSGGTLTFPTNEMGQYVTSGSKTLTYKIYPVGWTTALDNDDIVLEVSCLDSASGITRTTVVNTTNTYANGA